MEPTPERKEQWSKAAQVWDNLGSPLRPCREDVAILEGFLQETQAAGAKSLRALILGVTPELYHLPWPAHSEVKAIDHTQAMIDYVWPGPPGSVLCANWVNMPYARASLDMVLCDGGMNLLRYPETHQSLARRISEVLVPGGFVSLRLFEPPVVKEHPEQVVEALRAGRIGNTNCLKLRLGMAMQSDALSGIKVDELWRYLTSEEPDWDSLAARLGWPVAQLRVIDVYRDSPARYHFLSAEEVFDVFQQGSQGAFEIHRIHRPGYEMGEQCPTLILRRRQA